MEKEAAVIEAMALLQLVVAHRPHLIAPAAGLDEHTQGTDIGRQAAQLFDALVVLCQGLALEKEAEPGISTLDL